MQTFKTLKVMTKIAQLTILKKKKGNKQSCAEVSFTSLDRLPRVNSLNLNYYPQKSSV